MNKPILLTGASGLVGRRFSSRLLQMEPALENIQFLVGPSQSAYELNGQRELREKQIPFAVVDLATGQGLDQVRTDFRTIFHLAASTDTSVNDHECNTESVRFLLAHMKTDPRDLHFIFTSTLACLDHRPDYEQQAPDVLEISGAPENEYGRSKWKAEQLLIRAARESGCRVTFFRLPTTYGPRFRPNSFFEVLRTAVMKGSLESRLNWPAVTSLLHVEDAVDLLLKVAADPPEPGEIRHYNISGESLTLSYIFQLLADHFQVGRREFRLPKWFWASLRRATRRKGALERILPVGMYNFIWRLSLVVDPVIWSEGRAIRSRYPEWKPRALRDSLSEIYAE